MFGQNPLGKVRQRIVRRRHGTLLLHRRWWPLYLEVAPNSGKRWFWKYIFDKKEKRLALDG